MEISAKRTWALALLVILAAAGCAACTGEDSDDDETLDEQLAEEDQQRARFGLDWRDFEDHAVRQTVEECHRVDPVDLQLLQLELADEELDPEELAPALDEDFDEDGDEFELERKKGAIVERARKRLDEMTGQPLCVEHELVLGEYDFDEGGFGLPDEAGVLDFDDRSASARQTIEDLEDRTSSRHPPGFALPQLLVTTHLPTHLTVDESEAEALLDELPETESEEASDSDKEEAELERFSSIMSRMEPEAFEAELYAEEGDADDEKPPIGEVFKEIEAGRNTTPEGRKAKAVFVFTPDDEHSQQFTESGIDVVVRTIAGAVTGMVVATPDGGVFGVEPASDEAEQPAQGERVEVDRSEHDPLLEAVCPTGVKTEVATQLRDGELVDVRTPRCRRCPSEASVKWEEPALEELISGSFSYPGAVQALVRTMGCEGQVNGGGGMTLIEKTVDDEWKKVDYASGGFDDLKLVPTDRDTQLMVSRHQQVGGGVASGWYEVTTASPTGLETETLFRIHDNSTTCDDEYLVIEHQEMSRSDLNDDGVDDLTFELSFHQGERSGTGCDYGEDHGIGDGESIELEFLVEDGRLRPNADTEETVDELKDAINGEN